MKVYEYQAKEIFAAYGMAVQPGFVCRTRKKPWRPTENSVLNWQLSRHRCTLVAVVKPEV